MTAIILGGSAQPVQTSNQAPSGGPAIPVAIVDGSYPVIAGPYQPVVEVTDNRARIVGPALPVVVGTGSGVAIAGDPIPVYVVSGSFATAPVNTVLPAISGTQAPGATLTTTNGTWLNTPTSYTYQWKRGGVDIGGATANTYVLTSSDNGTTITVTITATNAGGSTPATSAGVAISAIHNNLISYWKMDEVSGTRADSVIAAANTLTDNNTVTSNPGKISLAGQFTAANLESLSHTDNASLSTGDIDYTVAFWVYFDSKGANRLLVGKTTDFSSFTVIEYLVWYVNSTDRIRFSPSNGTTSVPANANNLGSPALATWYFVVAWRDKTANTVNIQVNDGTVDSASWTYTQVDLTVSFRVGGFGTADGSMNGRIDEVGFWKRVLTAGERTALYNAGAGYTWPFV